jgi:sugar/nucleoside kinase (ribokinase family)
MALDALKRRYPGIIAGITDGPGRAWLITPEHAEAVAIAPRKLDLIVNPLGAGDVASAVFLARYTEGMAAEEAFTEALEAATRSCMNEIAGLF